MTGENKIDNKVHEGKMLPLTILFGNGAEGTLGVYQVQGVEQDEDNPEHTDILITSASGVGNDIDYHTVEMPLEKVFNILMAAHKKGEVADLSDGTLTKQGLLKQDIPQKGLIASMFS